MKRFIEYTIILLVILVVGWIVLRSVTTTFVIGPSGQPGPTPAVSPPPTSQPLPVPPSLLSGSVPREIVRGDKSNQQVIFTFDGGAGTQSAQAILATLAKHHVQATFFLTGTFASKNPDLVKQIAGQGHEIFNHTYTHPHLPALSDEQIINEFTRAEEIIINLTGKSTKPYFRPPYGDRDTRVLRLAASQGYQSIFWTTDAMDWRETEGFQAQESKERILSNIKPGEIYLLHIGDTISGQILDDALTQIKAKGYRTVPLSQGM